MTFQRFQLPTDEMLESVVVGKHRDESAQVDIGQPVLGGPSGTSRNRGEDALGLLKRPVNDPERGDSAADPDEDGHATEMWAAMKPTSSPFVAGESC